MTTQSAFRAIRELVKPVAFRAAEERSLGVRESGPMATDAARA